MRLGLALGAAAIALGLPLAEARAEGTTYGLEYTAATGCPTEEAMRASVAENVHDRSRAAGARVDLTITLHGDTFVGELVATDQEGNVGHRSVGGEKAAPCAEVARALAFIAALAIEYGGRLEPTPAPPPKPKPPPPPPRVEAPPPPPSRSVGYALALGGDARGGLASAPRPAGELAFEIFDRPGDGSASRSVDPRPRIFAPLLHLGAVVGGSHVTADAGAATIWLVAARVEACPIALGNERFSLRPCVATEAGAALAKGEDITPARSAIEPWFVGELGLRADVWLSERVFLAPNGGLVLPFSRSRYFFEPNTTLYQAPRLTGRGGLSIGVRLGAK